VGDNIPVELLAEEAPKVFWKETVIVVWRRRRVDRGGHS
jgi:hypothetical protein